MHGRQREEEMARIEFPANELRLPRPFYAPGKLPMTRGFRSGAENERKNGDGPFDITDFDITESYITNLI